MSRSAGIVPIGADNPQVLHALTQKYAEISGKVGEARLALQSLLSELAHVDAAIRIFDPTINIGKIRAKVSGVLAPPSAGVGILGRCAL